MFRIPFFSKKPSQESYAMNVAPSTTLTPRTNSVWIISAIKYLIYIVTFLVPLLYVPVTQDALFSKVILVEIVAVLIAVGWLTHTLISQRISYRRTPLNLVFLILAAVLGAAMFFSASPWSSFWGPDPTGERVASLLSFVIISFVAAAVLEKEDVMKAAAAFESSALILGLYSLASIVAGKLFGQPPQWLNANPIGTVNALGYVLGIGFITSLTLALTRTTSAGRIVLSRGLSRLAVATSIVCFLAVAFIGFATLWIDIAAVAAILLALNFAKVWRWSTPGGLGEVTHERIFSPGAMTALLAVFVVSVFFAYKPLILSFVYQPPVEVSPSFSASYTMDRQAVAEKPFLGFGPANFGIVYNRFHDRALNTTIFWATRFNHSFSFFATILATLGVVGFLVFLALAVVAIGMLARGVMRAEESESMLSAFGAGAVFVLVMWFLYASNFTASFLLFLFLGFATVFMREPSASVEGEAAAGVPLAERRSWWRVRRRTILIDAPAVNFVASLVVVFTAAFSLIFLYGITTLFSAEVYFARATDVFNSYGNLDSAKIFLDRAISLNGTNDVYYQSRAQVSLVGVQRIIAEATQSQNPDLAGKFRTELTDGVSAAKRATELAPANPLGWFALGQLYETVIPFIPGASQFALDAYQHALDNDPVNPAIALARGRTYLTVVDLATAQMNQASGNEHAQLEAIKNDALKSARSTLENAVSLKSDYADANFLLAQVAIREGNLADAIKKTETTFTLAPNDVGVAFQLGVLYFRADELDNAKAALDRAVLLNDNYSNARYFLGLIYDRKGDRAAALSQFMKIAALNPDNTEVKRILANLQAGKAALAGIVPPAPAPETRKQPPIEEGSAGKTPLRQQ